VFAACSSSTHVTAAAERLQREDLVVVYRTLSSVRPAVSSEVSATKAAWPQIAGGLPAGVRAPSAAIRAAIGQSAKLSLPPLFEEHRAASITGPGSSLASLFRSYVGLSKRGWQMLGGAIEEIGQGSPASARFARANVDLYIESIYDGHFSVAQIGKQLLAGYKKLGGASAFGTSLTQAEVDELADTYSEGNDRLHPHTDVHLGS
jgi:hypothetical protein